MSIELTINGTVFTYPQVGDTNWGSQATLWASAVTSGMLQKAGGTFTLTAEVDFGATYGLKTAYYKTRTASNASAGAYRLARADVVSWRNQAGGANLDLGPNSSNILQFNGEDIISGAIVNADIDAAAAIVFSKMATLTASRALQSGSGGVLEVSAVTATELGYISGLSSSVQTQITARLPLAGGTMTGDFFLNADPSAATQAATKQYVDNASAGNLNNYTVRVASTAAVNLASELENGDTIDGVVLATGNLVLVKNQASTAANGIYLVPVSGAASRDTSMDTWTEAIGASIFVTAGTANAATTWKFNTAAGGTLGSTAIPITQSGASQAYSADGLGLELSGSVFGLELDGTTLSKSATGLKVNEISNTQIAAAAAIAVSKLAAVTASRALVSDGSGFISAATTTATEIGYLNLVTSSVQTQLDARIAKVLTTTTGDMIYASSANTPARLAVGTSGYVLQSNGTIPVWTDKKVSLTWIHDASASLALPTSWTSLTLSNPAGSTPWGRSGNNLTPIYSGWHQITVSFSDIEATSARNIGVRLYNVTDSATLSGAVSVADTRSADHRDGMSTFVFWANVDSAKTYQVQVCASGSSVTATRQTIVSEVMYLWQIMIENIER